MAALALRPPLLATTLNEYVPAGVRGPLPPFEEPSPPKELPPPHPIHNDKVRITVARKGVRLRFLVRSNPQTSSIVPVHASANQRNRECVCKSMPAVPDDVASVTVTGWVEFGVSCTDEAESWQVGGGLGLPLTRPQLKFTVPANVPTE